jgi:hypothetical protein
MSFFNKIIAKLAGLDPQESEQATLARTQIGHEAMPDSKAAFQDERAQMRRDMNREREQEEARYHEHLEARPVPDADVLHHEMVKRAEELASVNKRMEEERLNKEAEARVKEKVAKILEEKKAA